MRRKRRAIAGLLSAAMVAALGGCGMFGGKAADQPAPTGGLEKSVVKVAELKIVDATPIHLAIDNGLFEAEGLKVDLSTGAKGSANLDNVMGGSIDIGLTSYPPAILAQAKKVAELKIITDAVTTTENLFNLVVKKNGVSDVTKLAGKKIAVSSPGGIGELALRSQFKMRNIPVTKESFASMAFADMPSSLERGDVDAAIMNEPYLTQALQSNGVTKLMSPFSGSTDAFPTSGWVATKKFTEQNPKTVAAFQRAMNKAVELTQDRSKIEGAVVKYVGVKENIATLMNLPIYPTGTDATRFQRVVELMHDVGEMKPEQQVDMKTMVLDSKPK